MASKPQHQGSLTDQLKELISLANKEGLYDAADWVKKVMEGQDERAQTEDTKPGKLTPHG